RGFGWMAVVHPDDRPRVLKIWQRCLTGATPVDVGYRVRQRDGSYRHVRAQGTPMHNADGSVREWTGALVDVDDQMRAEEALRASEAEFRANFELAGIGQAQADPNTGRFLRVNPRLCEMLGYSAEELLSKTFFEITHPEDLPANANTVQPFLRGETGE